MEAEISPVTEVVASTSTACMSSNRLGLCEVCNFREAKYTCPRCEVKSCSLKCNKIHKLEVECDGQRDRTKFIPLNKFTNLDLSSDYRLLEEVSRNIEVSRKKFSRRFTKDIPYHLIRLQKAAEERKTILKFLPYSFARHRNNSTRYLYKNNNVIIWHIEFVFINADLKLTDAKIPETEKLGSVLSKYFEPQSDESLQEKLQYYQAAGLSGVKIFLKAEQKKGKKFFELDPTISIKECLQRKLVIEYPTIHVVLKDHSSSYDVIDSDQEESANNDNNANVKSGNEVISDILKSEDDVLDSLKNLLFVSDYSDDEDIPHS